jgi:hypothetical protein
MPRTCAKSWTLARIDRHSGQLEELDVKVFRRSQNGFCWRWSSEAWTHGSDARGRFQQLFFPDGIAFDGNRFVRTGVTAPAFS